VSAAAGSPASEARAARWWWLTGAFLLFALVLVVTHLSEERALANLLQRAQPAWLLAAALLQLGTDLCAAGVWYRALDPRGARPRFRGLVQLGLAKLFTDQAVPSAGLSGTLLVVRGLTRRGVSRGQAMAAMLVGLVAFYFAYALAVAAALTSLWTLGELSRLLLLPATVLAIVAAIVPALLLGLRERLATRLPASLLRVPGVRKARALLSELPRGPLWRPRVAAETIGLQLGVFLLDSATLAVMLAAVSAPVSFPVVFVSFVSASVVATLAWVPGGIGTFEGTCVVVLRSHGVPLEAALAATLLLRGFTFWLPMAPGLWLARRELRPEAGPPLSSS
jgi:uncharacterized membrane protein YbhN (UPF0104 family)